jgi:hypothetical protein
MNQVIIPGCTQTNVEIGIAFLTQAPTWLPQHRDFAMEPSLMG